MLRILYVVHAFFPESYSGTEKFTFNVANEMRLLHHNVSVLTYSFYEDKLYDKLNEKILKREFEYENIPVIALKKLNYNPNIDHSLIDSEMLPFAKELILQQNPDIVHITHSMRMSGFIDACIELNIPYVLTLTDYFLICPLYTLLYRNQKMCTGAQQGNNCNKKCNSLGFDFFARLEKSKIFLTNAKAVYVPSMFVKHIIEREFSDISCTVINHGLDYSFLKTNNKFYKIDSKITFGYIGGITYHKGIFTLLEAFKQLKSIASLKLYGNISEEIIGSVLGKNDTENVKIMGVFDKSKIGEVFNNIDVLVVPSSWHETYCFAIHEAVASRVPVIAANIGAIPEKIKNCFNGFLFQCGNAENLNSVMQMIVEKPEILNYIKDRMDTTSTSSIFDESQKYIKEYHRILNGETLCVETLSDDLKNIYTDLKPEFIILFEYRIRLIKNFSSYEYIIWGTGSSGQATLRILSMFIPNLKFVGFIDKYKLDANISLEYPIYKPENITEFKNRIFIIATNPGKKEAEAFFNKKGLTFSQQYIYGYGV